MLYLRQATGSQSVLIGPFVDETDGVTAEDELTIANTDIRLSANGGNMAAKNSGGGTHDELGFYTITFDATDTATVGRLQLASTVSGALPVYHEFQILEEALYDALFASGAASVPADVTAISGDTTAADNLEAALDGTGSVTISADLDGSVGSVTGAINTAAGTITTLDGLDTAQDTQHSQTQTDIAGLNDLSAAAVNAEVVDALNVDTYAEPGQGTPAATASLVNKIGYLYKAWRNKHTQTATEYALYADDGSTKDQEAGVTDDGTTFTRNEISTGA